MLTYKNIFLYLTLFCFLLLSCIFSFYLFNPFNNKCIQGNCENGKGVYIFHSGMKYDGEWKNGKRDGLGTLTYPDGTKYAGGWKNNRMHGQGMKIYTSDRRHKKYIGEWKNGNKHGKGTAIYSDNSRYEGHWKEGKTYHHGTVTTIDGRKITGEWKNGELLGKGTVIYPDGKILVAVWKDSKKNGRGTLTYPDGTTITQEWSNDRLVGSLGFYTFRSDDFEEKYSQEVLCSAIKKDISPSLLAHENSIKWLNDLLKISNLYEKFDKKIHGKSFSQEINVLIEGTKDIRNKKFSELNNDNQKDIVKLNRLLLEHFYPQITPKH